MSEKKTPNASVTDGFDFIKKMWGGLPMPSVMSPTLDLNEIDKRISDLKTVEQWLNVNLSMLRASIQGLEVQRGTIETLRAFASNQGASIASATAEQEASNAFVSNASAWWNLMQEQFSKVASAALSSHGAERSETDNTSSSVSKKAEPATTSTSTKKTTASRTRSRP